MAEMKEINYKEMKFNPFNLIGGEWMLVTAGNEQTGCNTMTASWGHLGCLWGHNDPTAVIYLRPSRYTKKFVDEESYFTLCVMDKSFKKQMAYLGSVSGRDEDKIAKTGLTPVYADNSIYFQEAKLVLICKKLYQSELRESGFLYQETIDESYPQRDFHTMYVGKIEKVLVRDDEYLKNMVDYGLKDRVALITGANNPQGIGATTAFAFAREGAKVVLVYKRIPRPFDKTKTDSNGADRYFQANAGDASIVESKLQEMNADYLIIESDISNEDAVKDIYAAILKRYGRVDVLVNNAADGDMDGLDTIEKITQQVIDDTFAVNVRGSILMTGEFIKHRGDYGRIINLSTDAAQVFAGQITYGASKATLEALTRSIALEVAKYGITVNAVAPGPTQTGWIDDDFAKEVIPIIPMGKLIQPQDIADTILFLASEQAKMITGQVIKISGGHAL